MVLPLFPSIYYSYNLIFIAILLSYIVMIVMILYWQLVSIHIMIESHESMVIHLNAISLSIVYLDLYWQKMCYQLINMPIVNLNDDLMLLCINLNTDHPDTAIIASSLILGLFESTFFYFSKYLVYNVYLKFIIFWFIIVYCFD